MHLIEESIAILCDTDLYQIDSAHEKYILKESQKYYNSSSSSFIPHFY